jgi:RNA polymerase sigma-70 factor (family 1)
LANQTNLFGNDLFIRFSAREPAALGQLMQGYFPVLCGYAEKFLGDESLAKDIVQEVFIKLWQYEGTFEGADNLKAFLFQLTKNGCLNMRRDRERANAKHVSAARSVMPESRSADEQIVWLEYLGEINLIVQGLPKKMREVFQLSFEEGLSIEEIAKRMGVSVKTVRNQKYKSLVILRKRFGHPGIPLLFLLFRELS